MSDDRYQQGLIVEHPRMPKWGPGKILLIQGSKLRIYFRDLAGKHPEDAVRSIDTQYVQLEPAKEQSDFFLDNLPPYQDGCFKGRPKRRVTFKEGLDLFQKKFPLLFKDPDYLDHPDKNERGYKWKAHELWADTLGGGEAEALLGSGRLDELRERAFAVEQQVNIFSIYERMALRDGLSDDDAAATFFESLLRLIAAGKPDKDLFESFVRSLQELPVEEGKTRAATWPNATLFQFLAAPSGFMFMKPEVTKACALSLTFDLNYRSELNWLTYSKLHEMSEQLLERLRPCGARDFIDVQSFIWLIGAGLKKS